MIDIGRSINMKRMPNLAQSAINGVMMATIKLVVRFGHKLESNELPDPSAAEYDMEVTASHENQLVISLTNIELDKKLPLTVLADPMLGKTFALHGPSGRAIIIKGAVDKVLIGYSNHASDFDELALTDEQKVMTTAQLQDTERFTFLRHANIDEAFDHAWLLVTAGLTYGSQQVIDRGHAWRIYAEHDDDPSPDLPFGDPIETKHSKDEALIAARIMMYIKPDTSFRVVRTSLMQKA